MTITRQTIETADRAAWLDERFKDVTSTEVSALFGLSSRCTAYELACLKAGKIEDTFEGNERTDWGTHLEAYIAQRISKVYGVSVQPKKHYMRIALVTEPEVLNDKGEVMMPAIAHGMGASFDFEITGVTDDQIDDNRLRQAFGQYGRGLLEIKNVDYFVFKSDWTIGNEPEAPAHIEVQLQAQLEVSDYGWGCIAALVGGNKLEIILRLRDEWVGAALRKKIIEFWTNIGNGIYPPISLPEDADIIRQLYSFAEPGKVLDARGPESSQLLIYMSEYAAAGADEKSAKDRKSTAQAQILQMIGDHERVLTDIGTITAGMIAPTWIEGYQKKGYRNVRVNIKKSSAVPEPTVVIE